MLNRPRQNLIALVLFALALVFILADVMLVPQLLGSAPVAQVARVTSAPAVQNVNVTPVPTTTPSAALLQARAVLARVRDEVVPREGTGTKYGMTFSNAGYETLMKWNQDFKVEARYADAFESLNLFLPCCDWRTPSRNEEKNCACGHHQALEGLSKKLLSDGWDSRAVQREVTQWTHYLFPKETVRAEMEKRAQLDAEMKAALEELKARGEC